MYNFRSISTFALITWIAKFVLFLILFYFIENGDIEKYDNFLECKYVKGKYFEKFNDVNKLRKCFLAFGILNIISESLDKAVDLFELFKKFLKNDSSILNASSNI